MSKIAGRINGFRANPLRALAALPAFAGPELAVPVAGRYTLVSCFLHPGLPMTDVVSESTPRGARNGPRANRTRAAQDVLLVLRLFLAAALTLWLVDVLLSLSLVDRVPLAEAPLARCRDYVALFVMGLPVALGLAMVGWIVGLSLSLLPFVRDRGNAAIASCAAALAAVSVFPVVRTLMSRPAENVVAAAIVPVLVGAAVWIALLRLASRHAAPVRSVSEVVRWVAFPALVVGLAGMGVARATQAQWIGAGIFAFAGVLVLGLAIAARHRSSRRVSVALLAWAPVLIALLLAAVTCAATRSYGRPEGDVPPGGGSRLPHIVLVVLDTVRADHLAGYGYSRDTMPALERWGEGALVGNRVISPAGWTRPAHASLLSGRTVSEHGIHYGSEFSGGGDAFETAPHEGIVWLPQVLASEGYHCIAVSANALALPPGDVGFDRTLVPGREVWYEGTLLARFGGIVPFMGPVSEWFCWRMPYADAESVVDIAMRATPDDAGPIFLFVNFLDAHSPYNPPARALDLLDVEPSRVFDRYKGHRELTLRWPLLPDAKRQSLVDLYDGELRWIDLHLERFLRWTDERFGENAVVIVTSDHGEELGEDGRVGHEFGLSQFLIHVPLFVRAPGLDPGDLDEPLSLIALHDFIVAAASGAGPGAEVLLRSGEHGLVSERYPSSYNAGELGGEYDRPWVAMIEGRYKGVGPSGFRFELRDVEAEGFSREVAVDDPAAARTLAARIDAYWVDLHDTRGRSGGAPTDEELETLRALGYVR